MKSSTALVAVAALCAHGVTFSQSTTNSTTNTSIDTVNVTSSRSLKPTLDVLADTTILDRNAINQSPASNLLELLQSQAAIEITQQGGAGKLSGIFVRGTKTAQVIVLIDGVRLENPLSGGANLEFLPLSAVERVEIVRGPASSFYGSAAMGGVIQIFTRQSSQGVGAGDGTNALRPYGSFALGTQGTSKLSAGVAGGDAATRWTIGLARDNTSGFEATRTSSTSFQKDRDGNKQTSVNAALSHRFSPDFEAGLNLFSTSGRSFYDSSFSLPADTRYDFRTSAVTGFLKGQLSSNWASELRVGRTGIFYDYFDASGFFPFSPKSSTTSIAWNNRIALDASGAAAIIGGIESANQSVTGAGVSTGGSVYGATSRRINSAFVGYETRVDAHSFRLQVRRDQINSQVAASDAGATTGTLAYGYRLADGWQFRASVGSAFRAPTFDDLYNPFGPNPLLKPEKSLGYELGIERRQRNSLLKLTAFSQRIRQAIELDSSFVSQNYDAARAQGLTAEGSQRFGNFFARGQLTLQNTHGTYTDFSTFTTVSGRLARRANVHGTAGIGWSQGDVQSGLRSNLDWQFQGDRIDTNGAALGGYGVINLSASYGLANSLGKGWYGFAKLGNVFDRRYELASGYNAVPRSLLVGLRFE